MSSLPLSTLTGNPTDYPDELAAMRSEQDELDAEERARATPLAEAVALLRVTIPLHERRRSMFDAAVDALCHALNAAVDARDAYVSVGETLVEAMRLVAQLRGGRA